VIGFLFIDKQPGWTSHDVVAKARGITRIKKIGHAGTLDPMATGLVVLGVGRATKLLRYVQDLSKTYVAEVTFGVATDSLDADGEVLSTQAMSFGESDLLAQIPHFVGEIQQVPPMVSALKKDGRRLHELAREGIEVGRPLRAVTIYSIDLLSFTAGDHPVAVLRVACGKGTYIRSLGDDLGVALGGRAHLTALRRVQNGDVLVEEHAITLDELDNLGDSWSDVLVDPFVALGGITAVAVDEDTARLALHGRRFSAGGLGIEAVEGELFRLCDTSNNLLGVYRVSDDMLVSEVVFS
jgi:tRNA pseudouridine55 synthase